MPTWITQLLGLANEATEAQVRVALAALIARPEATALANEQTARTAAETNVTRLTAEVGTLTTNLANERAALAAAQAAHAETLVGHAVAAGRITEAQKPVWLGRLKANFATESVALANEKAEVVKTRPRTDGIGARKPASAASDQFTQLVNERVAKGEPWQTAWEAVKATAAGKALFEQMSAVPAAATT